jgi:hypothetical protein
MKIRVQHHQTNIADSFTAEERHIADSHIARMFFTGGLHIFTLYLCCTVLFLCTSQNINFIVLLCTCIMQLFRSIWQETMSIGPLTGMLQTPN